MIRLTPEAAEQINSAARQGGMFGMALRVAAKADGQGAIDYALGFDDPKPGDNRIESEGVTLLVSAAAEDLLEGTTIDFVEIEPGQFNFIFINPNDPNQTPPKDDGDAAS